MANGLSDEQYNALGDLIRQSVADVLEEKQVVTKEDIKHLPTTDEFYTETAKIYKKLEDIEKEKDVLNHQVSRNSDRLDRVEKHLELPAFE